MNLKKFLKKANEIILIHIDDEDFNVGKLAEYLNLSRSQTLRKIKAATGCSANEYIREIRLQKALELLKDENLSISEIAYQVGYKNPSYFIKCFHDRFKYAPGEYRNEIMFYDKEEITSRTNKYQIPLIIGCILVVGALLILFFLKY